MPAAEASSTMRRPLRIPDFPEWVELVSVTIYLLGAQARQPFAKCSALIGERALRRPDEEINSRTCSGAGGARPCGPSSRFVFVMGCHRRRSRLRWAPIRHGAKSGLDAPLLPV